MIFTYMDYEQIARYIRDNGVYTGNMVDRLCEIIEENHDTLQELNGVISDIEVENTQLRDEIQDFRQWVTSLQGEVSDITERLNDV
jgi:chromosome segregation ATPase